MNDGTGLTGVLLGLDGFRVLEVPATPGEVVITVETSPTSWAVGSARWSSSASWWRSGT